MAGEDVTVWFLFEGRKTNKIKLSRESDILDLIDTALKKENISQGAGEYLCNDHSGHEVANRSMKMPDLMKDDYGDHDNPIQLIYYDEDGPSAKRPRLEVSDRSGSIKAQAHTNNMEVNTEFLNAVMNAKETERKLPAESAPGTPIPQDAPPVAVVLELKHNVPNEISEILERDAYKDLHDIIHRSHLSSFIIIGNPGIGKSCFSLYELFHIQRLGYSGYMVYESVPLDVFMVVKDKNICDIGTLAGRYAAEVVEEDSYYIFDAGTKGGVEPRRSRCKKTIVCTSPDNRNYAQFLKEQTDIGIYYMPIWSLEELLLLPNPSGIDVADRFWHFGGIPRYVFNTVKGSIEKVESALVDCNIGKIACYFGGKDVGKNSHRVLHLIVNTRTYLISDVSVGLASPFVTALYYKKLEEIALTKPLQMLIDFAGKTFLSAARGQLFEIWAHRTLVKGGRFAVRQLEALAPGTSPEDIVQLPKMATEEFANLKELEAKHSFKEAIYLQPKQCNFASVDSITQDKLFQMTVRTEHPMKMKGLSDALSAIAKDPKQLFKIYFVVPDDIFNDPSAFKGEQKYLTQKDEPAKRISKLVSAAKQYVLPLPLKTIMPR